MIFLVLAVLFLLQLPLCYYFPKAPTPQDEHYDIGIVLGCPCKEDGTLSNIQRKRMDKLIQLYHHHMITRCLISGADVHNQYIEAEVMAKYAIEQGIPKQALYLETKARNTYDNLKHAKQICDRYQFQHVVIITSRFHIRRSNFFVRKFFHNYAICGSDHMDKPKHYLKEYIGMWNTLRIEWKLQHQTKK